MANALSNLANSQIDLDQGDLARASISQAMELLEQLPDARVSLRLSVLTQAVQERRGALHFAVRLADQWLLRAGQVEAAQGIARTDLRKTH